MTAPAGTLAESRVYVHEGCPLALVTAAPRVEVAAGRLACTACGAWWSTPTLGAKPTGDSASDPGPRTPSREVGDPL